MLFVQVDEHLGVRRGREPMPLRQELGRELSIVVDLTVEDHPHGSIFVGQRLVAGLEVDDADPTAGASIRTTGSAWACVASASSTPKPANSLWPTKMDPCGWASTVGSTTIE